MRFRLDPLSPTGLAVEVEQVRARGGSAMGQIRLTTDGSSGAATFTNGVLNVPQYTGGSGGVTSITAGTGITVDSSTPSTPIVATDFTADTLHVLKAGDTMTGNLTIASANTTGPSLYVNAPTAISTNVFQVSINSSTKFKIDNTGNATAQSVLPITNATYNLGTTSLYWNNIYSTTLNLNSTASLTGATAGSIAVNAAGSTSPTSAMLNLTPSASVAGTYLLNFAIDRAWGFRQVSTGSGTQLELHAQTDAKYFVITSLTATDAGRFAFLTQDAGSLLGIGATSGVPTHSLTLGSTATGIALYNTTDQTTNYERVLMSWVSNIFTIQDQIGGTGVQRPISLQSQGANLSINSTSSFSRTTAGAITSFTFTGTETQASGAFVGVALQYTYNQTGAASATDLLINRTQTAVGTGLQLLTDWQVGASSLLSVNNTGALISHSTSPILTQAYNTSDEVTNFERATVQWSSNTFSIITNAGGTGVVRTLQIGNTGVTTTYTSSSAVQKISNNFGTTSSTGVIGIINSGTFTGANTATPQIAYQIAPTINQTGTSGYTALQVNSTETATGSGTKLLLDLQIGGSSKLSIDNTGVIQVSQNSTGAGSAALGANSPATTNTAPYTWIKMKSSDGSTVYVPAWK
jgi:hypothetical protein